MTDMTDLIKRLASGDLRPHRLYAGKYVVSRCGRALIKIGGGGESVAVATPHGLILADTELQQAAARAGVWSIFMSTINIKELEEAQKLVGATYQARWERIVGWMKGA